MQQFKNILCVIAPEEANRPTLERALTLAENNQAGLTVVDVIPHISVGYGLPDGGPISIDLRALVKSEHEQALESFLAPYRERLPIQHAVLMGTDFLEIIRQVLRHGHDLVIKPADNPHFIDRLFGSEDMHLLRKCPCPVWLSKPGETPKYSSVVAAVDFDLETQSATVDKLNERILELSCAFAVADFATLHFVHVWDAPFEMTVRSWGHDLSAADGYVERERMRHQQALDRLRERLKARLNEETFGYLSPRFHLHRGAPSQAIPELARQLQADLVVMGTLARTGIAGLFIGNTAETILEQLRCSVLAIKPPGFVTPVTLDAQPDQR
jgi:universal stress protein E